MWQRRASRKPCSSATQVEAGTLVELFVVVGNGTFQEVYILDNFAVVSGSVRKEGRRIKSLSIYGSRIRLLLVALHGPAVLAYKSGERC